ncbi:MAG: MBL fold metallo-hydrolase [Chloroflexota bacterium]
MSVLRRVTDNVWIFPGDTRQDRPNVGVICTPTQTILVDAGNSPHHARDVVAALMEMGAPPVSQVIYTHHHWDHVFGASELDVPAVAHHLCRDILTRGAAEPWSAAYLERKMEEFPQWAGSYRAMGRAVQNWAEFRIVVPSITFDQFHRLQLDDLTLEMKHVGGQHAADSIIVYVRERGVIFLGDCYYGSTTHNNGAEWAILEPLLDEAAEWFVDGHRRPLRRAELLRLRTANLHLWPGKR